MTTKEAPEFCAGVKILIERMETNPEDFAESEYDYARDMVKRHTRFGQIAAMLDVLVSGGKSSRHDTASSWKEWNYLSREEQEALLNAFRKMRRNQFDKQIMERVFDENFYQRQEEEMLREQVRKQQAYQQLQKAQMQVANQTGQLANQTGLVTTMSNTGAISGAQGSNNYYNGGGLLGGLGGMFK